MKANLFGFGKIKDFFDSLKGFRQRLSLGTPSLPRRFFFHACFEFNLVRFLAYIKLGFVEEFGLAFPFFGLWRVLRGFKEGDLLGEVDNLAL